MPGVYKTKANKARGVRGKWSYWFADAMGRRRYGTGYASKAETLRLAVQKEEECRRLRDGLVAPEDAAIKEHSRAPATEQIEAWKASTLANGTTAKHATQQCNAVSRVLAKCSPGATLGTLGGVEWGRVADAAKSVKGSTRTRNYHLAAAKAFVRWLVATKRLRADLLGPTKPVKGDGTASKTRRVLTLEEEKKLFDYLASGKAGDVLGVSPAERSRLYLFALGTGLRADEIRNLEAADFDRAAKIARVRAETTKGRRAAKQPIPDRVWIAIAPSLRRDVRAKAFRVPEKTAKLLRADLKAAGVAVKTADGEIDFHALRHTFVTRLVLAGVDVKTVQTLARHADVTTTLKYYARPDAGKLREAVEKIS